ncbi:hypothetical protein IscW_ISCW012284, partial [Ixodes scapularis]
LKLNFFLLSKVLMDGLLPPALKTRVQKHAPESSVTKRYVPKKSSTAKKKKKKNENRKFYELTLAPSGQTVVDREKKTTKEKKGKEPRAFRRARMDCTRCYRKALWERALSPRPTTCCVLRATPRQKRKVELTEVELTKVYGSYVSRLFCTILDPYVV